MRVYRVKDDYYSVLIKGKKHRLYLNDLLFMKDCENGYTLSMMCIYGCYICGLDVINPVFTKFILSGDITDGTYGDYNVESFCENITIPWNRDNRLKELGI